MEMLIINCIEDINNKIDDWNKKNNPLNVLRIEPFPHLSFSLKLKVIIDDKVGNILAIHDLDIRRFYSLFSSVIAVCHLVCIW